ncbi:hypothetical protein [Amycolatopsis taiwanensis]|uniref:hypothetical protein n=1 Tax=Amycolatopsis taiwanensis TaxID=342230 RepID=UPI0004B9E785|nr:hypothetical protein [Amycolatopsis taiwanensis]
MKIRIEGTPAEIEAVLHELPSIVEIREVSRFYPNRGSASVGRRYVTIVAPVAEEVTR